MSDLLWFNAGTRFYRFRGKNWKPYNLFIRCGLGNWGVGLLQVGRRHLLYVGRSDGQVKVWLGFVCIWKIGEMR